MQKLATFVAAVAVAALAVASWAVASSQKVIVRTTLKEFKVISVPAKVKPGPVVFTVKNTGKLPHELVVLKTALAPAKLPKRGAKAVEVGRVGRLASVAPGATKSLVLTLKAGKYVLLCNLPAHYAAGQRAAFIVA